MGSNLGQGTCARPSPGRPAPADRPDGRSTNRLEQLQAASGRRLRLRPGWGPVHATPTKPGRERGGVGLMCAQGGGDQSRFPLLSDRRPNRRQQPWERWWLQAPGRWAVSGGEMRQRILARPCRQLLATLQAASS